MYILEIRCWDWAFKTDISPLFLFISVIFLQKAMVQYTIFKTVLLYLLKVYPSLWTSARNQGTLFSYLRYFWRKIVRNQPKKMTTIQFYLLLCVIFQLWIPGITSYNLDYLLNQFYWLQNFEIGLKQSLGTITLYFRQLPVRLYWVLDPRRG